MYVQKELNIGGVCYRGTIAEPSICPLCGANIKPIERFFQEDSIFDSSHISTLYLCPACKQAFTAFYEYFLSPPNYMGCTKNNFDSELVYCGPVRIIPKAFVPIIYDISPRFVEIYHQAEAVELYGLSEIIAMSYRKALEFLVRDFCISKNPELENKISTVTLSTCINTYLPTDDLKAIALGAAWIGNDGTHYKRIHENYDYNDIKAFIDSLVNQIVFIEQVKEAKLLGSKD